MNTIISGRVRKLVSATLIQPWILPIITAPKVQLSTLPTEPVIAAKKPFKVELIGGKRHSWCACGHSKKQPFCDGAHKTKAQGLIPLRFVPEKDSKAWLCGCKYTANPPYCDGTHKQEFIQSALLPVNTHS
ncbi:CDGSH iron-sulfur domain-containing protein 3, mitochondrial [Coregonus clupeaformis]|uniref:CDGSH iron-sulfur domain-containing protein 3, mitochondrial n=1 Tax=Coregonus clupeaformis TaxID=59861 RepID=UPI001BE04A01|nr:CDGSH iron-sulfur domain-containing protein 3, mitochondrial [Coregonus clupeaformis]